MKYLALRSAMAMALCSTCSHGRVEVVQPPGQDHDIVHVQPARHNSGPNAHTLENWRNFENAQPTDGEKLANGNF